MGEGHEEFVAALGQVLLPFAECPVGVNQSGANQTDDKGKRKLGQIVDENGLTFHSQAYLDDVVKR